MRYIEGRYPDKDEIALSILNSKEMNVNVGDTILVYKDWEQSYKPCILQSLRNLFGYHKRGKTAKARFAGFEDKTPVMWCYLSVS